MKKTFVLVTLFVLPIVIYLFFASGVTNFGKLSMLTEEVSELGFNQEEVVLKDKITILGFLGKNIQYQQAQAFNLNQKIYKRFYQFEDFQFVMVMPKGTEAAVEDLKEELGQLADAKKWNFLFGDEPEIRNLFESLKTNISLGDDLGTPYVFIIDKEGNLRGREAEGNEEIKYGFNALEVAELNNMMIDDVKIILAEYRMALKKNNTHRKK
ncbi:hypothetical protein KCTC52924_00623 [Arenibacter antarcticus]|uniref:Uncharacterized protein n=1 Tax=Arenibacter antarcticus TaxID=2040469 RepID=A0ABW5VDR0_9FLAO|nr:hypothetical protein [Arenibacter sp. H213]MCM4169312.1 hypothetical protein [Arenibacter sp. H213]